MTPAVDLRSRRLNLGLSIEAAAKQMGVSRETLLRAERGDALPHPRNALKIADFHGLQVTDVWPVEAAA